MKRRATSKEYINHIRSVFILFLLLASTIAIAANADYQDDFETDDLSSIWSTERMEPQSYEIQSSHVRHGEKALKITIHQGDKVEKGSSGELTERDELSERYSLRSKEGVMYEYGFSFFLPEDFPIVPTRLILAQWKQVCPRGTCGKFSPVLALRYQRAKLYLTLQTGDKRKVLWLTDKEIPTQWYDFKIKVMFSRSEDGVVNAYLNNRELVNYRGVTSYQKNYYGVNTYYFKMGLYRDQMPEPMSIYIDSYSKKLINERTSQATGTP